MLKYMRKKAVSVDLDDGFLKVRGILDDDIYSLEIELSLDLRELKIRDLKGRWNRQTTNECSRALMFLNEAIGLGIRDAGFPRQVHKVVGRRACRHFANLLLECCEAASEAALILAWKEELKRGLDLTFADFAGVSKKDTASCISASSSPSLAERPEKKPRSCREREIETPPIKFLVDLHIHTSPASPCSSVGIEDVVQRAKEAGLNAICLTDHNYLWERETVEEIMRKEGMLILRGNEITTDQGDMLVFGLEKNIEGIIRLQELREEVLKAGGAMIAAHPFRGFLTFGVGQLGLTPQQAMERAVFRYVDAIEVLNGKVTEKENAFAAEVAAGLGLTQTGGSDAHQREEVGIFATGFECALRDKKDLIEALKTGYAFPVDLRKKVDGRDA